MGEFIKQAIHQHPGTCAIVVLYSGNVCWYLSKEKWGPALYWVAAATITISATWLMGWESK